MPAENWRRGHPVQPDGQPGGGGQVEAEQPALALRLGPSSQGQTASYALSVRRHSEIRSDKIHDTTYDRSELVFPPQSNAGEAPGDVRLVSVFPALLGVTAGLSAVTALTSLTVLLSQVTLFH